MLWAWTFAILGFFTLSRFKLDHYIFPAAPALCLLIARAADDVRAFPDSPAHRGARIGFRLVGPLLMVLGAVTAYFLVAQLDLPATALIVPVVVTACGLAITVRRNTQPPRVPWIALTAVTVIYAGIVLFVMPALERQKVIPDIAAWVATRAEPETRIASYQLNRWNTAFRFYVGRHVTMLDDPEQLIEFVNSSKSSKPFYCVMLGEGYDELVARGVPLQSVYAREGMWATSGRALWRKAIPATRFVVVTLRDGTER
jgi:4-amino-4-deoxy-L-arabinose transferase-like glycosyltransferase